MEKAGRGFRALAAAARRPRVAVPALLALAAAVGLAGWALHASSMRRWAREEALPRARALADQGSYVEAYQLAAAAEQYIPTDPALRDLWPDLSRGFSVETMPEGADATWKPYADVNAAWQPLGTTPVRNHRLPLGPIRIRLVKPGYLPLEVAASAAVQRSTLLPEASTPPDMVRVPAATLNAQYAGIGSLSAQVPEYLIDRDEVTNRDFKRFVDAGGYTTRAYWTEPFVDGDRTLSWENAMRRFVDPTGRPGPATWDGGAYKDGEADVPVAGVSWYEAAAYAAFAGREPPHGLPLVSRGEHRRQPLSRGAQQFFRERPHGRRAFQCDWFLRSSRYGRQRSRVVLERERPSALSARRLLGGSGLHVDQGRTGAPARSLDHQRIPLCQVFERPVVSVIDGSDHPAFRRPRISVLRLRAMTRSRSTATCTRTSRPM